MADVDPDAVDDGTPVLVEDYTTNAGFLEHVMIHETLSPEKGGWNKDQALIAMRLMRQVIDNRSKHPVTFGAGNTPPGPASVIGVLRAHGQYGAFENAPNFPHDFIAPVNDILAAANNPRDPFYKNCRIHVRKAIRAATEPFPPADLIVPNLYYWRTAKKGSPAGGNRKYASLFHPYRTVQGNTFWTEENVTGK